MKMIFTLLIVGGCSLLTYKTFAQTLPSGSVANFGIDGDLKSNYHLAGSWDPSGTHDWFKNTGTTAIGVIDTTGASTAYAHLLAGENYAFDKGMSVPRYSVQDGYLLLDARYGRDCFAFSSSGPTSDLTTFGSAQKNGFNPINWITTPLGGAVADKSDIIDAFVHMRRNGSVVNGASSSHLIATMAASTASNNGTRFFDVEFFCTALSYNSSTGAFSNSGPAASGGHTAWSFNPDGTIQQFGDMSIAFSFSGSDVSDISIWIWVSSVNYLLLNPAGFDFVPGEFYGAAPGALYGYAKITANPGNTISAWGGVTTSITSGPAWGTCSKSLGANGNNYDIANYDVGQLGEAAIDLTALGIDPALLSGSNACNPPFKRVLVKSRSSSTFTSALQDFAGPYEFLDAPTASAAISPIILTCQHPAGTLQPQAIQSGDFYHWSTSGGNITTNPDSTYVTINKAGKYYLQAAIYKGCSSSIDSVVVQEDILNPVATASTSGTLDGNPSSSVVLYGGDPVASNVITPFGGSQGLSYSWTGPSGFTSTLRNPSTYVEGTYVLTVTEIRNGCKSIASTTVIRTTVAPLPVKLITFQGNMNSNKVTLTWTAAQNEIVDKFEVERSFDGVNFSLAGVVMATKKSGKEDYIFYETANNPVKIFYRLKMYDKSKAIEYSKTLAFQNNSTNNSELKLLSNPAIDRLTFSFQTEITRSAEVDVLEISGRVQIRQKVNLSQGANLISIPLTSTLSNGMYVLELSTEKMFIAKFIKQ